MQEVRGQLGAARGALQGRVGAAGTRLESAWFHLLKGTYAKPLSNFACIVNVRPHTKVMVARVEESMRETRSRNLKERDVM